MYTATICLIGEIGAGKGTFGNLYLQSKSFERNDSPQQVTKEPKSKSAIINGIKRIVIDTATPENGNIMQVYRQLVNCIISNTRTISSIVIVINGQCDRFSKALITITIELMQIKTWRF